MEESLNQYLNRKMRRDVTPSEVLNRVRLLFPDATMDKDGDEVIIKTKMTTIGEGLKERFIPLVTDVPVEEDVVEDGKDKDKPPKGKTSEEVVQQEAPREETTPTYEPGRFKRSYSQE
jgi:hypothetical protein